MQIKYSSDGKTIGCEELLISEGERFVTVRLVAKDGKVIEVGSFRKEY